MPVQLRKPKLLATTLAQPFQSVPYSMRAITSMGQGNIPTHNGSPQSKLTALTQW